LVQPKTETKGTNKNPANRLRNGTAHNADKTKTKKLTDKPEAGFYHFQYIGN
jgi:hypothetical protein